MSGIDKILWLRAETKEFERRTPLTPQGAKSLIEAGANVHVERCPRRIFSDREYEEAGCKLVPCLSWKTEAPQGAYILGLKELQEEQTPLFHHHIYFAHAFKGQNEAPEILARFQEGRGHLYDLEFLLDENDRRVAAFGHWAGYVGCAIALDRYFHSLTTSEPYAQLRDYEGREELLAQIKERMQATQAHPKTIVIGSKGRCGKGAVEVLKELGLAYTPWDYEETKKGGPFQEILEHEVFVNTVLLTSKIPPFISGEIFTPQQKLKIISDVSCDPNNPNNPVPLYDEITSWQSPFVSSEKNGARVEILAVDNLPSVLPKESSEDFAMQLLPHLKDLLFEDELPLVWKKAYDHFLTAKERVLN